MELNKNRLRNRLIMRTTWEVVRLADVLRNDLVQLVFDELKVNKERSKLALHTQTKIETNEAIVATTDKNASLKSRQVHKQKVRAIKKGVLSPFRKLLNQYFGHWKTLTVEHRLTLTKKIKQQVVKVYQNKLRVAFEKMKAKGNLKKKKKKMMVNMQMESSKATMEDEL